MVYQYIVVLRYSIDTVPVYICMSAASIAFHFSLGTYLHVLKMDRITYNEVHHSLNQILLLQYYHLSCPIIKSGSGQGTRIQALFGQKQSLHLYAIVIHIELTECITSFLQILSLRWSEPYPKCY